MIKGIPVAFVEKCVSLLTYASPKLSFQKSKISKSRGKLIMIKI